MHNQWQLYSYRRGISQNNFFPYLLNEIRCLGDHMLKFCKWQLVILIKISFFKYLKKGKVMNHKFYPFYYNSSTEFHHILESSYLFNQCLHIFIGKPLLSTKPLDHFLQIVLTDVIIFIEVYAQRGFLFRYNFALCWREHPKLFLATLAGTYHKFGKHIQPWHFWEPEIWD